jgi:formate-dependent nitrite reductase cytochrome c552 subunit
MAAAPARGRLAAGGAVLALLLAPLGWVATDRLERDDAFCVSCHLPDGTPLHRAKGEDLEARPAATLAAAHAVAGVRGRADPSFRCIDCHGGRGLVGRARVKLLSARDAFWYVLGRFEEPERMRWPLWDRDCSTCHGRFEERVPAPGVDPAFHELAVHNTELGVACVACHGAHGAGGLADHDFIRPEAVRARCADCHPQLAP